MKGKLKAKMEQNVFENSEKKCFLLNFDKMS